MIYYSNVVAREPPDEQEIHVFLLCVASQVVMTLGGCYDRCKEALGSFFFDQDNLFEIPTQYHHQQPLLLSQHSCLS